MKKAYGKRKNRIPWMSIPCPRGCGARWHHYIYMYKGGSVCRIYWNRGASFSFAPKDNKPIPSFRVVKIDGKWQKHPTNPAWKDGTKLKRCC